MSIVTVRDSAGSEEASGVSTRGIELFAWVRAGGCALGPCAGYEAAAALTERRQFLMLIAVCAISAMAHSRHGLGHRPFEPAQIMSRPERLSLRHFGRRKPEHGSRHAQTYDQTVGDKMSRTF